MIVYLKQDGTIANIYPSVLTQGSNVGSIVLIGQGLSNFVSIGVTAKLPVTNDTVNLGTMTPIDNYPINDDLVYVYYLNLNTSVTNFNGVLELTFNVMTNTGKLTNSYILSTQIVKGLTPTMPTTPTDSTWYTTLLANLAQIYGELQNIPDDITSAITTHNTSTTAHADIRLAIENIIKGTTAVGKASYATNAGTADKANQDGEGNNIAETYQTKSNLVTAWGVPTDDKYPSAKLVKTTIDGIISGEGSTSFVFNTEADFDKWIAGTIETDINGKTKADLIIGSNVLLKEENVPDYWCSSISDPLTKADFTPYEAKINLDNYLAKNNTEEFIPTGDYNPATKKYVDDKVLANIGVENLLGFNGSYENNVITFTADETLADFTLKNNTRYNMDLRLPPTALTGDLNNAYTMVLNFNGTSININNILVQDPTQTATVGSMCTLQNYEPETGYSWRFNALYTSYTENNTVVHSVYTEDVTRETNPSMTGNDFAIAVADSKLKVGTTVMVTSDFTNNGTTYKSGHTYLVTGEWTSGTLMLSATDITSGGAKIIWRTW